jgi:hypothetical protein
MVTKTPQLRLREDASVRAFGSAARYGADYEQRLRSVRHRFRERRIRRLVGQIALTGEEAQEGPPALRGMIANSAAQGWKVFLQGVKDRLLSCHPIDLQRDLAATEIRVHPEMRRKNDADHVRV